VVSTYPNKAILVSLDHHPISRVWTHQPVVNIGIPIVSPWCHYMQYCIVGYIKFYLISTISIFDWIVIPAMLDLASPCKCWKSDLRLWHVGVLWFRGYSIMIYIYILYIIYIISYIWGDKAVKVGWSKNGIIISKISKKWTPNPQVSMHRFSDSGLPPRKPQPKTAEIGLAAK
jgi:hypothetical protein